MYLQYLAIFLNNKSFFFIIFKYFIQALVSYFRLSCLLIHLLSGLLNETMNASNFLQKIYMGQVNTKQKSRCVHLDIFRTLIQRFPFTPFLEIQKFENLYGIHINIIIYSDYSLVGQIEDNISSKYNLLRPITC